MYENFRAEQRRQEIEFLESAGYYLPNHIWDGAIQDAQGVAFDDPEACSHGPQDSGVRETRIGGERSTQGHPMAEMDHDWLPGHRNDLRSPTTVPENVIGRPEVLLRSPGLKPKVQISFPECRLMSPDDR
jgi:hypothetical protein